MTMGLGRQFLWFCVAGVAGLVVDATVLYVLQFWLGWYVARLCSFLCAVFVTWSFNQRYTFQRPASNLSGKDYLHQFVSYLLAMAAGGVVNYGIFAATIRWISFPGAWLLGVVLGSCGGMLLNFISARWILWRKLPHTNA